MGPRFLTATHLIFKPEEVERAAAAGSLLSEPFA
jgi:hypothetical protein